MITHHIEGDMRHLPVGQGHTPALRDRDGVQNVPISGTMETAWRASVLVWNGIIDCMWYVVYFVVHAD